MRIICLICFIVNVFLATAGYVYGTGVAPIALALISAGLCLAVYLQK